MIWKKTLNTQISKDLYPENMKNYYSSIIKDNPIRKRAIDLNRHFTKETQMANKHIKNAQHH